MEREREFSLFLSDICKLRKVVIEAMACQLPSITTFLNINTVVQRIHCNGAKNCICLIVFVITFLIKVEFLRELHRWSLTGS